MGKRGIMGSFMIDQVTIVDSILSWYNNIMVVYFCSLYLLLLDIAKELKLRGQTLFAKTVFVIPTRLVMTYRKWK